MMKEDSPNELQEELSKLREELKEVREENQELRAANQALQEQLTAAHQRIDELEKQKTPPPSFVKANVVKPKADEKKARKKREPQHNRARRYDQPTQIIAHPITCCPDCGDGSVASMWAVVVR